MITHQQRVTPNYHGSPILKQELMTIYTRYEQDLQTWIAGYDGHISCRKGCSACCDVSIGLYLPEAFVLADLLSEDQYARVKLHAQRVLTYAQGTSDYLAGFRFSDIGKCPLLETETGSCGIYDYRPANCRHLFSNMSPDYCRKETELTFERDAEKYAEFLQQLDPGVNADELPFIGPLRDIFQDRYEIYLMILSAKHSHFILSGEMSWLITLAREHHLWEMVTEPGRTVSDLLADLQNTGVYHEHVLTDCQEVLPEVKEQSAGIEFMNLC